ncbi:MAG: hypothetical protein HY363_03725 [Candidatus Aenigmarchaeota archaeon]|nr:hypothetical protein [Candidatus Aenigmarchaeota archaeon]
MAELIIDVSDKITVNSATQSSVYSYAVAGDRIFVPTEISLSADSNFQTNGKVTIVVGGKPLTSQNSQIAEIALSNNLTLTLPQLSSHPSLWKALQQGQNVDIKARITTGSGVVQVSVVGVLMTPQEYEKILAAWTGGV